MRPSREPPPAKSHVERVRRAYFLGHRTRSDAGAPLVSASFVAELGRRGRIIDVRSAEEVRSPIGYIPGAIWCPPERISEVAKRLPSDAFVVLVSRGGDRACKLARILELLGMHFVAAMSGGMRNWRHKGFMTRHDDDLLLKRTVDTLEPHIENEDEDDHTGHDHEPGTPHPLTVDDVRQHIGDPGAVRWVKLAAMVVSGKLACVDGRDDRGIVGSPGGNAGEFLLALGAIEMTTSQKIDPASIERLLIKYIDAAGTFYMHSDSHAFSTMIGKLKENPTTAPLIPPDNMPHLWRSWMQRPPETARAFLLELLSEESAVLGCGHIKRALLHPAEYGVRAELTKAFLRAIWRLYWSGSTDIAMPVLSGNHNEAAVLNVILDEDVLTSFSLAPMVSPSTPHGQLFLNTPQVAEYLREAGVSFMLRHPELVPLRKGQSKAYHEAIAKLANQQAAETLGALAKGLPVYQVVFHDEERFTVTPM